jgi:hypothetical protein
MLVRRLDRAKLRKTVLAEHIHDVPGKIDVGAVLEIAEGAYCY